MQAKAEENREVVAMPLLELGPSTGTAEGDNEVSNSSSDERTRSTTPPNNGKNEINDTREESLDSDVHPLAWGNSSSAPNKLQKLNPSSNSMDQSTTSNNNNNNNTTEATMRKARVSVRARSEAPMVCNTNIN